jgi:hypothetical protein
LERKAIRVGIFWNRMKNELKNSGQYSVLSDQ